MNDLRVVHWEKGGEQKEYLLEEGVIIRKQRNQPASCTVTLPRIKAVEDASPYSYLRVYYRDKVLFDGHTQTKSYSKDNIKLSAVDWLWDFGQKRKNFQQGTTSLTPSEAFTDLFDDDSSGSYFTAIWDDVMDHWLDGYDAVSHVVLAETAASYGDPFYDCKNKSGLEFMDFLAKLSYRGNKYKYFYWYEFINGVKSLFFEPDGWGKLWEQLQYTIVNNLTESCNNIYNNIVVWGRKKAGKVPFDGDLWTEEFIDGWRGPLTSGNGMTATPSLVDDDTVTVQKGNYALKIEYYSGSPRGSPALRRNIVPSNLESLNKVYGKIYFSALDLVSIDIMFIDDDNKEASYNFPYGTYATWQTIDISKDDFTEDAGFDWKNVQIFELSSNFQAVDTEYIYIDNLYLELKPNKSENINNSSGYDADSVEQYGLRTPNPIVMYWLDDYDSCNAIASTLVNYFKDPQYSAAIKLNKFVPFGLNENVSYNNHGKELVLPIDQITWTFGKKGMITTDAVLGNKRENLIDVLKHFTYRSNEINTDYGNQYEMY